MRVALVLTTIHVPEVLKLYRACDADVMFFITGDRKSPDDEIAKMLDGVPNHTYYGIDWQQKLGYSCSTLIGENTISRRNIAILEALKWGAEIIVTIDDDNAPLYANYFKQLCVALDDRPAFGLTIGNPWFDPGSLYEPAVKHRGFPFDDVGSAEVGYVADARIGAAMGLVLGDTDVSAKTRAGGDHMRQMVKEIARAGIVVSPGTWTVLNTQNTAFIRQFAPCWLLPPQWKRFDDIFASMIAQRVMRDHGYVVHIGQPFVYQQRNPHNLDKDHADEKWGEEHTVEFAEWLDRRQLPHTTVLDQVRYLYSTFSDIPWMPEGVKELGLAWCEDCETVL